MKAHRACAVRSAGRAIQRPLQRPVMGEHLSSKGRDPRAAAVRLTRRPGWCRKRPQIRQPPDGTSLRHHPVLRLMAEADCLARAPAQARPVAAPEHEASM